MGKVVQLPEKTPVKFGHKKAKSRRKRNPEDYGQLNLFSPPPTEARIIKMSFSGSSPFEDALVADENGNQLTKKLYLEAIEKGDCVADAYCNLGIIEAHEGNNVLAVDYLSHSLATNSRHSEAHYNLANIFADLGNLVLARLHYEISIKLEPEFPSTYYNYGLLLIQDNKIEEAVRQLEIYSALVEETELKNIRNLIQSLENCLPEKT